MLHQRAVIPAEIASFGAQNSHQSWLFPGNALTPWHLCGKTSQKLDRGLFLQAILWKRSQRRSWRRSQKVYGEHCQDGQHYKLSPKTLPKVVGLHNSFLIPYCLPTPQKPSVKPQMPLPGCPAQGHRWRRACAPAPAGGRSSRCQRRSWLRWCTRNPASPARTSQRAESAAETAGACRGQRRPPHNTHCFRSHVHFYPTHPFPPNLQEPGDANLTPKPMLEVLPLDLFQQQQKA